MNLLNNSILPKCLLTLGIPALLGSSILLPARSSAQTISSTVSEDNGATTNATDPGQTITNSNQDVYTGTTNHPGVLTTGGGATGTGYNFSSSYTTLTQISAISITLTVLNGSSATAAQEMAGGNPNTTVDDYDVNHLVLYLGGTYSSATGLTGGTEVMLANNTPLYLNGLLTNDGQTTLTLSSVQVSTATGAAILSTLKANGGLLAAYVGTTNANDSSPAAGLAKMGNGPAELFLGNVGNPTSANAVTTLALSSVPEPGAATVLLGAGAVLLMVRARSRRSRHLSV